MVLSTPRVTVKVVPETDVTSINSLSTRTRKFPLVGNVLADVTVSVVALVLVIAAESVLLAALANCSKAT
jgi:hypothetical protein